MNKFKMFRSSLPFFALLVACGLGIPRLPAVRLCTGRITGSVTDATGAAVAGATVTATQTETNQSRKGTTNGSGYYTFSSVPPGTYQILINKPGFDVFQTQNVDLRLNTVARIDAVLAVGTAKQSVTVSAQTAQLQTDRADVNAEVTSKDFCGFATADADLPGTSRHRSRSAAAIRRWASNQQRRSFDDHPGERNQCKRDRCSH